MESLNPFIPKPTPFTFAIDEFSARHVTPRESRCDPSCPPLTRTPSHTHHQYTCSKIHTNLLIVVVVVIINTRKRQANAEKYTENTKQGRRKTTKATRRRRSDNQKGKTSKGKSLFFPVSLVCIKKKKKSRKSRKSGKEKLQRTWLVCCCWEIFSVLDLYYFRGQKQQKEEKKK